MTSSNKAIICAAGFGSRLGMSKPKAIVKVGGKTIIEWQLEALRDYDVTVVVGYKGNQVEKVVNKFSKNNSSRKIEVVYNDYYMHSGIRWSICCGAGNDNNDMLILDGDLLFTYEQILNLPKERFIGVCKPRSEMPVFAGVYNNKVTGFTKIPTEYEWACIFKGSPSMFLPEKWDRNGYPTTGLNDRVCDILEKHLPIKAVNIDCYEIDTISDLEGAKEWMKTLKK